MYGDHSMDVMVLPEAEGYSVRTFTFTSDPLWSRTGRKLEESFMYEEDGFYQTSKFFLIKTQLICALFLAVIKWKYESVLSKVLRLLSEKKII